MFKLRFPVSCRMFICGYRIAVPEGGCNGAVGVGIDLDMQAVGFQEVFFRQGADSPGTADGLVETNHLLGMVRHHRKIMGDQHHRQAALLLDVREDIAKHLLPRGVHAGGRLVEQEDLRIPFQGHGQEDPLHFSTGQFPRKRSSSPPAPTRSRLSRILRRSAYFFPSQRGRWLTDRAKRSWTVQGSPRSKSNRWGT